METCPRGFSEKFLPGCLTVQDVGNHGKDMKRPLFQLRGQYIIYHGPLKPTCLEVFMVNNLVFRWPKPLLFMVLGAHGNLKARRKIDVSMTYGSSFGRMGAFSE